MDAERFDAVAKRLHLGSRRTFFGALIAGTLLGEGAFGAAAKKKKGKKKCDSYYVKSCGRDCCSKGWSNCCPSPYKKGGKECFESGTKCCPAEFGGGACDINETCCPPRKGEIDRNCINTALGERCCPLNSGGYCGHGETCCPPEKTNSSNYGCCSVGEACCNTDSDCNLAIGDRCYGGCCS